MPSSNTYWATNPPSETIQDRPNFVIVNKAGTYGFLYHATGSVGQVGASNSNVNEYVTGSLVVDGGPVQIPIQPVAWNKSGTAGTLGDITFIYTGVK